MYEYGVLPIVATCDNFVAVSTSVPRLLFDGWRAEDFQTVLGNAKVAESMSGILADYLVVSKSWSNSALTSAFSYF